jgi:hypothetical protein
MKTLVCGLALTALACGGAQAQDRSDAMGLRLMAECRAAGGGAALDRPAAFHETGTVIRDGHAGTYEMYADLHALRTVGVHTLDGKVGGGGFDGKTAWSIGPDGKAKAITDPEAVADARSGAYFTIGGYNWPDRFPAAFNALGVKRAGDKAYDVVRVTPQGATPADLWLDQRSHRIERLSIERNGVVVASGDILDYRPVDGTWIGFKNHQVEGEHHMTQTLATYDYVPLDPARFTPPGGER